MASARDSHSVLTVAEMMRADAGAIRRGIAGERLMEAAGRAVADEVQRRFPAGRVVVLCGPGNNGGDGFVAARHLAAAGREVRLALLGARGALQGDAANHAARWSGPVESLSVELLEKDSIVVDALFGAGLSRPLDGLARAAVSAINARALNCVAVDVPSGVSGDTGEVSGDAPRCAATVTFFRKKPAHLLLPGRLLCGEVTVADIGIPDGVLDEIKPSIQENHPDLWLDRYLWPKPEGHKYSRGHAVVVGGVPMTGAGRLSARAAMRAGAGLVTVAAPQAAHAIFATAAASLIMADLDGPTAFDELLRDKRKNVVLLGPGNGAGVPTRLRVLAALQARKACVLDADALTSFADDPAHLCRAIARSGQPVLLTPHDGELSRLFPDIAAQHKRDKLARARAAAATSGAVVLLKGYDTVVAAPDGRAVINANASADLATAGAGDVLAGFATALIAQGMNAFDAACAAAWLHGDAATRFGPGLIADDLVETLPASLKELKARTFTLGEN
jgi:ADP-dependent NAD(P)H-hydrate dehydratase / NAD(P)H-hydrate epimerase